MMNVIATIKYISAIAHEYNYDHDPPQSRLHSIEKCAFNFIIFYFMKSAIHLCVCIYPACSVFALYAFIFASSMTHMSFFFSSKENNKCLKDVQNRQLHIHILPYVLIVTN